jgi:hypothetical protein
MLWINFFALKIKTILIFVKCSIEFDRDDELFATAGVSKRIKVFEFSTVSELFQGHLFGISPLLELLKFNLCYFLGC